MNKKWVVMALALAMVLSSAAAFASSLSITTADLTSEGATLDAAVVSAVSAYIDSTGGPAIDYFGDALKKQVEKLLPAGVSADSLVLYEAVSVDVTAYTVSQLTSGITINVASGFSSGTNVIILVGIPNGLGGVEWFPVKATVSGGQLTFKLSKDVAAKFVAAKEPATFVVLGGK